MKGQLLRGIILGLFAFLFHVLVLGKVGHSKEIKLLFASFTSEKAFMSAGLKAFAKDLEERTDGQVKVEFSWGGALGKIPEYYDLTVRGVTDVGLFNPVQCAKEIFLMASLSTLPWNFPNSKTHTRVLLELYKRGFLDKQLNDEKIKTLFIAGDMSSALLMYKKPVQTINDIKGAKLHCVPGMQQEIATALGAVPVDMAGAEVYMALKTGMIDGHFKGYSALPNFKWCEVTKYITTPYLGSVFFAVAINRNTYNRLPESIRKVIDEMAKDEKYSIICAEQMDEINKNAEKCLREHGVQFLRWQDLDELNRALAPVWEKWVAEREAKGLPAKKAIEEAYAIMKDLGVDVPALGFRGKVM